MKTAKETEVYKEDADESTDVVGEALVALNHLSIMADDLYSALGDEPEHVDEDQLQAILNAYDLLSGVYDKLDAHYDYASDAYDDDEVDDMANESVVFESKTWKALLSRLETIGFELAPSINEDAGTTHLFGKRAGDRWATTFLKICSEDAQPFAVINDGELVRFDSIKEALETIEELTKPKPISEGTSWKNLVKLLSSHGMKAAEPGKDYGNADGIAHVFGIPMRAGKWADTWFTISFDDAKPYALVVNDKTETFDKLSDAIAALKKVSGNIKESVNWSIIEDLGDNEMVASLRRIKDCAILGLAESVKLDEILAETVKYDEKLTQAIVEFRDAVQAKADSQLPREPVTEDDDIQEGRSFDTFSDSNLKKWLVDNWTERSNISAGLKSQLAVAAAEAKKRDLQWTARDVNESHSDEFAVRYSVFSKGGNGPEVHKEKTFPTKVKMDEWVEKAEDAVPYFKEITAFSYPRSYSGVHEAKSVQTWNLDKAQMDPNRLEVIGQDGSAVAKILDKVLPGNKANVYDTELGFKSTAEREKAAKAIVDFYKNLKEEDCTIVPLGNVNEAVDENKFKMLAKTGLVNKDDANKVVAAMRQLEAGKTLTPAQKDLISSTFQTLIGLITGDTSVFAKVQATVKKEVESNDK